MGELLLPCPTAGRDPHSEPPCLTVTKRHLAQACVVAAELSGPKRCGCRSTRHVRVPLHPHNHTYMQKWSVRAALKSTAGAAHRTPPCC